MGVLGSGKLRHIRRRRLLNILFVWHLAREINTRPTAHAITKLYSSGPKVRSDQQPAIPGVCPVLLP